VPEIVELVARFLMVGAVAFGGDGFALPLVERITVAETGWLTPRQFTIGVGFAYATPRPLRSKVRSSKCKLRTVSKKITTRSAGATTLSSVAIEPAKSSASVMKETPTTDGGPPIEPKCPAMLPAAGTAMTVHALPKTCPNPAYALRIWAAKSIVAVAWFLGTFGARKRDVAPRAGDFSSTTRGPPIAAEWS
jgi:hypothetical protein